MKVYKLDTGRFAGRFIVARWCERNQQYQSTDIRPGYTDHSYCFSYACTLERLAETGIRTYPSLVKAMRKLVDN